MDLAKKNHEVHFISYSLPARLDVTLQNIIFHQVNIEKYSLFEYQPYSLALSTLMVQIVKNYNLDVLHVHYAIPHAYAAYIAKQILKEENINLPVVTTLHGTDITLVGNNNAFEPVVAFSINKSDGVTAVSEDLKRQTYKHFNVENDIQVIYNFIDFERFSKLDKDHFKKAIAPNGERILAHVSNFRKVKRAEDVVHIFKRVYEKIPSKLLMIGDGPERHNLEELCRNIGLCHEIRFLGKQDAVEELLAVSDLFVLPSASESFGLAALEAMACEVPVISSNAGGLPEVNVHGKTGFLSDIGNIEEMSQNAIHILGNDDVLARFRKNALAHAKKFDIANILPQYEEYYQMILDTMVYTHS